MDSSGDTTTVVKKENIAEALEIVGASRGVETSAEIKNENAIAAEAMNERATNMVTVKSTTGMYCLLKNK